MKTLDTLVSELRGCGALTTGAVVRAFRAVDRAKFVPPELRSEAYEDAPLDIGSGQTISQPYVVALMLELLGAERGERVLDVGSGSGYTTVLLAHIVGESGRVFGVERIPRLVQFGKENLTSCGVTNASIEKATETVGLPREAPFDRILVSASAPRFPDELMDQLRIGGVIVIPVGSEIWQVKKKMNGTSTTKRYPGFLFVPLVE